MKKILSKKTFFSIIVLLLLVSTGTFGYQYYHTQQELQKIKNQSVLGDSKESSQLIKEVGTLIKLPEETPTIATVTDKNKLNKQRFFENAQNGDKVLIYSQNKKAILYRQSTKQIIEVAQLSVETQSSPSSTLKPKK